VPGTYFSASGEELEPLPLPERPPGSFKLELSQGGETIAVYSESLGNLAFYEVATGREICSVDHVNYQTLGCTFYDAASKVLVPMRAGGLLEIDLEKGKEIRRIDTDGKVYRVCVNAAETQILACLKDARKMQFLDVASGETVKTITPPSGQVDAAFSPNGRFIAYGDETGVTRCQSLITVDAPTFEFTGHRSLVHKTRFVLGGEFLVTTSWDGTTRLWNTAGSQLILLEGNARVDPDGKRLLVRKGRRVQLLEIIQPLEVTSFSQPTSTRVPQMAFSANSSLVAICSDAGTTLASFPDATILASFGKQHHAASFDPDGETLVTSGRDGLRVWNLGSLRSSISASTHHVLSEHSTVLDQSARASFARSADGALLATATPYMNDTSKRRIHVMERATGATVADLPWSGSSVISLLFDPQNRWMAASSWRGEGFNVWDTKEWKPLANPAKDVGSMQLSVNHDGSLVASSSASEVCLWDTSTWHCLRRFPCEPASSLPYPVDFSPDGTILAHGYDPTHVHLIRIADGTVIATLTLPVHDEMRRLLFSPDQKSLGVSTETRSYFFHLDRIRNRLNALGLELGI
jgi:WD40 repeat protein